MFPNVMQRLSVLERDGGVFDRRSFVQCLVAGAAGVSLGGLAGNPLMAASQYGLTPSQRRAIVNTALRMVGKPYRWGAAGPNAFDCSGLTQFCYRYAGLYIPRTANDQYRYCRTIDRDQNWAPSAGCIMFFSTGPRSNSAVHCGIGVGGWRIVHASSSQGRVVNVPLTLKKGWWGTSLYFLGALTV